MRLCALRRCGGRARLQAKMNQWLLSPINPPEIEIWSDKPDFIADRSCPKVREVRNGLWFILFVHRSLSESPLKEFAANRTGAPASRPAKARRLLIIRLLQQSTRCCARAKSAPLGLAVCLSSRRRFGLSECLRTGGHAR